MIEVKLGGTADRPLAIHVLRGIKGHLWLDLAEEMTKRPETVERMLHMRRS